MNEIKSVQINNLHNNGALFEVGKKGVAQILDKGVEYENSFYSLFVIKDKDDKQIAFIENTPVLVINKGVEKPKQIKVDLPSDTELYDFNTFWDIYHNTTQQSKTDREPALKYWSKIGIGDRKKAILNIMPYYNSLDDKGNGKFPKKARTYLSDKNYNDEFKKPKNDGQPKKLTEKF